MKLSDYLIDVLVSEGINCIFEVCGGSITHILDSLYKRDDIKTISMHHEMAAAIAAEGYSRASENFGVAMATSGPGATNLITGIGSCYFDSIPTLFITGQVNTYEYKTNKNVRQIGFQETDIVSIVKPITKYAEMITDEHSFPTFLYEAISLIKQGRGGPVLLDIPMNIQRAEIEGHFLPSGNYKSQDIHLDGHRLQQIRELFYSSKRPIILAGGGIRLSGARNEFKTFVQKSKIPVVVSLMGHDSFPHDDPLYVGMIGTYGNRYANIALANADLILALGTRLDTRQTGTIPQSFGRGATIIQVDIDPYELNNKGIADYPILMDIQTFLEQMIHCIPESLNTESWRDTIIKLTNTYPSYTNPADQDINPNYFMHRLSSSIQNEVIYCIDVGQVQMWASQSLCIRDNQRFLTQGGMASIGSALPLGIGASFAKPGLPVIVIAGDGGFQLNIQELQTIYHHQLPLKIIVLNNGCYGMVRQFQDQYFGGRHQSTVDGYSCPDFIKVASAYNIPAFRISTTMEIPGALSSLFHDMSPMLLEVMIPSDSVVTPKLSINKPIEDQEPYLRREELHSHMFIDLWQDS